MYKNLTEYKTRKVDKMELSEYYEYTISIQKIAIYEQDGKVNFGKNHLHTESTILQQNLHNWRKDKDLGGIENDRRFRIDKEKL